MSSAHPQSDLQNKISLFGREALVLVALTLVGGVLAYIEHICDLKTVLVEIFHALVVTVLFVSCLVAEKRYPQIKQFGWTKIVWGAAFIAISSWADILDEFEVILLGIPFGHSWQQAFLEKILGYSVGMGLVALGFFQWVPWMIHTRENVYKLNNDLRRLLMSLDDHVESERLNISRELHDDVAQRLTYLNYQAQLCRAEIAESPDQAREHLKQISQEISETLKSIRQISRNLRPESLYALGFIAALEEFIDKQNQKYPKVQILLNYDPLPDEAVSIRLEERFDDRELLHLFRIIQEGIRNALKHSKASEIRVHLAEDAEAFHLTIEDNGVGLPWETLPSDDILIQQGHLGIAGLRERVSEVQGTFQLRPRFAKRDAISQSLPGATMEIIIRK